MKCFNCGKDVGKNQKFCMYCGAELKENEMVSKEISDDNPNSNIKVSETNKEKSKKLGIIGAILIIGILVSVLAIVISKKTATSSGHVISKEVQSDKSSKNNTISEGDIKLEPIDKSSKNNTISKENIKSEPIEESTETVKVKEMDEDVNIETIVYYTDAKIFNMTLKFEDGEYKMFEVYPGLVYWKDRYGYIVAIGALNNANEDDNYAKMYYYHENELIYATYSGESFNQFYFEDGKVVRWVYDGNIYDEAKADNTLFSEFRKLEQDIDLYLEQAKVSIDVIEERLKEQGEKEELSIEEAPKVNNEAVKFAFASSYLAKGEDNIVHLPELAIDKDLSTAWMEGDKGEGWGETLTLYFDDSYVVSGLNIYAGYQKSEELYYKNSRPYSVYIRFSDGSNKYYILDDINGLEKIEFEEAHLTHSINIRVDWIHHGNQYENVAITEIEPF